MNSMFLMINNFWNRSTLLKMFVTTAQRVVSSQGFAALILCSFTGDVCLILGYLTGC